MKNVCRAVLLGLLLIPSLLRAEDTTPPEILGGTVDRIAAMIQPPADAPARTFVTRMKVTKADGLPKEVMGATIDLAFQAPDKLRMTAVVKNENITVGRNGQSLWFYNANTKWGVVGSPDVPKFSSNPRSIDRTPVPPFELPINPTVVKFALFGAESQMLPAETIENNKCHVVRLTLPAVIQEMLKLPAGTAELAIRQADSLPARIRYSDGRVNFEAKFEETGLRRPYEAEKWELTPSEGDNIEKTATAHLVRFLEVGVQMLNNKIPTLGSATGERKLVARSGNGRLEMHDGTRVLFLKGTPAEMGRQHGELLRKEIRDVTHRILYGVGVGSSFVKGKWFFGEIEAAHARLAPYISPRMYAESDALADAVGLSREEVRLANFFPELFHCSRPMPRR
jgi:outer membrane lipoprotein-sorting protein